MTTRKTKSSGSAPSSAKSAGKSGGKKAASAAGKKAAQPKTPKGAAAKATSAKTAPAKASAKKAPSAAAAKSASRKTAAAPKGSSPAKAPPAKKPAPKKAGKEAAALAKKTTKAPTAVGKAPAKPAAKKPPAKKVTAGKATPKKSASKKAAPREAKFAVGDKVAHLRHGPAVITGVTKMEIDGEMRDCFVLSVEQPAIPADAMEQAVRPVVSKTAAGRALRVLKTEPPPRDPNWTRWYKSMDDKQNSGDIFQVAEAVRDLTQVRERKGASESVQQRLSDCLHLLTGEIAFALGVDRAAAARQVERALQAPKLKPAPAKKRPAKKPAAKKAPAKKSPAKRASALSKGAGKTAAAPKSPAKKKVTGAKKPAPKKKPAAKKAAPKKRAAKFSVGDMVAHPQHGVAEIIGVKQIEIDGEKRDYFVLKIFIEQLTVSVPKDTIDETIRPVISKTAVSRVLRVLRTEPEDAGSNWSRWYKVLGEKQSSGDIFQVAEVVRDLTHAQNRKGISPALKRMLSKSRLTLTSEISFALKVDPEEAVQRVDKILPLEPAS